MSPDCRVKVINENLQNLSRVSLDTFQCFFSHELLDSVETAPIGGSNRSDLK